MKRILLTICALFLIAGCASNRSGSTEATKSNVPDWWFNPATSATHFYAFAQAKKQNPSLAQKTATERARADISSQVKAEVQSELRDWMQESGAGENAQALEFTESTIISASENALQGASPDKYEQARDGTVYIRVSFPKDAVERELVNAAKREEALYNEFKASQAFDRMEKQYSD